MQNIRVYYIILALALLQSCASFSLKQQSKVLFVPELGSIIKINGGILHATSEQVTKPDWKHSLEIKVQQIPFNKHSFNSYNNFTASTNRKLSLNYVDSLAEKPKYIRLQIADRVALIKQLNSANNAPVRNYIVTDKNYKLVTACDMVLTAALMNQIATANKVTLKEDRKLGIHLVLTFGKNKTHIPFSEIEVFDYEYASFCWSEDRYHNKKIETILSGTEKCPKGTYKKAQKLTTDTSYLKF